MNYQSLLGAGIIVFSLLAVIGLFVWSVRRIETIQRKKLTSLRQISREFGDGPSEQI